MLFPPFWRGRRNVPAGQRIERFRSILRAAHGVPIYCHQMKAAHVGDVNSVTEIEQVIASFTPISKEEYEMAHKHRIPVASLSEPEDGETRSATLVPYAQARLGLMRSGPDGAQFSNPYSPAATASATGDLYRLSKSLRQPHMADWRTDHAVVVFSGTDAGVLTDEQRDSLWRRYQIPLFEQFVGPDGVVVASECEIHAGLHVRLECAVVESIDGEIVLTSLTDETHPTLRLRTGILGNVDTEICECGRTEPRLVNLRTIEVQLRVSKTTAVLA
jgi:hypothetical protein